MARLADGRVIWPPTYHMYQEARVITVLSYTIVYFKRLGSRHFVKEMKIPSSMLRYNMIFRKTNLKPFKKYIQKVSTHPDYQI